MEALIYRLWLCWVVSSWSTVRDVVDGISGWPGSALRSFG